MCKEHDHDSDAGRIFVITCLCYAAGCQRYSAYRLNSHNPRLFVSSFVSCNCNYLNRVSGFLYGELQDSSKRLTIAWDFVSLWTRQINYTKLSNSREKKPHPFPHCIACHRGITCGLAWWSRIGGTINSIESYKWSVADAEVTHHEINW